MKVPKEIKLYCKKCNSHETHKLKEFKTGAKSVLKQHARKHEAKHVKGYGGKTRFIIKIKKQGKKPTFVAICSKCGQKRYFIVNTKAKKKAELV